MTADAVTTGKKMLNGVSEDSTTMAALQNRLRSRAKEQVHPVSQAPAQICSPFSENSDKVLDMLLEQYGLKYDSALARMLGVAPSIVSKLRNRKLPIGPALLLRILEITNSTLSELQQRLVRQQLQKSI